MFPSRAQARLLAEVKVVAAPVAAVRPPRDEVWTWYDSLPAPAKAKAEQRLMILQKVEAFEAGGSTRHLAVIDVAAIEIVAPGRSGTGTK